MSTFQQAVCDRFGIAWDRYEWAVLSRCMALPVASLAAVIWLLNRRYFADDMELIFDVAACTCVEQVCTEIYEHRRHRGVRGIGRRLLNLRVSGRRLVKLAATLLPTRHRDVMPLSAA